MFKEEFTLSGLVFLEYVFAYKTCFKHNLFISLLLTVLETGNITDGDLTQLLEEAFFFYKVVNTRCFKLVMI